MYSTDVDLEKATDKGFNILKGCCLARVLFAFVGGIFAVLFACLKSIANFLSISPDLLSKLLLISVFVLYVVWAGFYLLSSTKPKSDATSDT